MTCSFVPNTVEQVTRGIGGRGRSMRGDLAGYNAHIEAVDREIARLVKCLDENGLADNTVIVYTSDHGEMLGAQNRTGKRLPHEESCRVPFVVRAPGTPAGNKSDVLLGSYRYFSDVVRGWPVSLYPKLAKGGTFLRRCEGTRSTGRSISS